MAERILEQGQNLPIHQSSGDNMLNEFKREVTLGIYSRNRYLYTPALCASFVILPYILLCCRRVSLSNMQPSFIWVTVDASKKSDVLNESVMCTMSASKVGMLPRRPSHIPCNIRCNTAL